MNEIKQIKIDGYKIQHNLCKSLNCRISLKQFNFKFATEPTTENDKWDNNVGLTHIEVMRWINECESFEYRKHTEEYYRDYPEDKKQYVGCLMIETTNYSIYVDIPKGDRK